MNFMEAIKSGFANYANFSGRAQRSAFWYWILFAFLVGIVANILDWAIFGADSVSPLSLILGLALLIPDLSVGARRLHDIGRSGWWQLLHFVPLIGLIILIVWYCKRGEPGPNQHGPNPLGMM